MFSKILQKIESSAFQHAARKGELRCPNCGASLASPSASPGDVLDCPECGGHSVARSWVSSGGPPRGWADRPPADTKIQRKSRDDGALMWDIPASGKSGGFLFFAIIWCTITGLVSGGFLMAFLFGEPAKGKDSVSPVVIGPILLLFFGIFWAIGLGMFYVAARNKWARTRVVVTSDEVILGRRLFGRVMEKRVPRSEVSEVNTEEFYQSNDTPVYGIAIHAGKRKLKFGTVLREDEKGWLAADIRRELLGEEASKAMPVQSTTGSAVPSTRSFSLLIPDTGKHLWPFAIVLTLMGIGFAVAGFFVIDPPTGGMDRDGPLFTRIFDAVFTLFTTGFRFVWLLISLAMTAGGVWMGVSLLRKREVERRFEGDASVVAIRKVKLGRIISEETFPRSEVSGVFTSSSGHSNGRPMNRIDLQLRSETKILAHWVAVDAAERFVAEAQGYLWEA
jgi:hypothetical protein